MIMRVLIFIIVVAAALAIYFAGIKLRLAKQEAAASVPPEKKVPNSVIWILIAAWSAICVVIGGVLARCTEKPSKEVVLTVVEKAADKDSVSTYFRLSDGYTVKISSSIGSNAPYNDWVMVKKGDKVRKLIFESQPTRYTPVFDESVLK